MALDCSIPRPNIADLHDQVTTEMSARLLGGAPVVPMSNEDVLAFIMAGTVNLMWAQINQGLKETDPAEMCCDNLVSYAARRGIFMQSATRARGLLVITGTPGTTIPANIRFVATSSREYKLDPSTVTNPKVIGPDGTATLRVSSVNGGVAFNVAGGTQLTLATTIPGINATAVVTSSGLIGGANDETCDELRARVLATEQRGVIATNYPWYFGETLKWPGVTRVSEENCNDCCNDVEVTLYPFFEGTYEPYGIPPASVIDEMNDWMFGRTRGHGQGLAPIGAVGEYRQAAPALMTATLSCASGCLPDAAERAKQALELYARNNLRVGSSVCKQHLISAVLTALGTDGCVSGVTFEFASGLKHEDDAFFYLDCTYFLAVADVVLV